MNIPFFVLYAQLLKMYRILLLYYIFKIIQKEGEKNNT